MVVVLPLLALRFAAAAAVDDDDDTAMLGVDANATAFRVVVATWLIEN